MHKKITIALSLVGVLFLAPTAKAEFASNTCEGRFSVSVLGGIAPNIYVDRENANASAANPPAFELINIPSFGDQFNMPFILQGELGYMVRNDWEVFYDFDWSQGKGKSHSFSHEESGTVDVSGTQKFKNFNGYGNYLGSRYYLTYGTFPIKPFAGFKIGIMTRGAVKVQQVATSGGTTFTDNYNYFKSNTTISGGLQIGLDWQLTENLSLLLKGEFIATGYRKSGIIFNHSPNPVLKAGNASAQFSFPVTLGARWTF